MRRRRRQQQGEVELNLAAMLDMAFQLLAFFILTFRPSPIEGQLLLHLPPPSPVTDVEAAPQAGDPNQGGGAYSEKSLSIRLLADVSGHVTSARVGLAPVFEGPATPDNLAKLDERLKSLFGMEFGPYEQVLIRVDPKLHYEDLMKVIDVCTRQKLPNGQDLRAINFAELNEAGGEE
jgi:biopolymer transport protein ExbD